MSSHRETRNWLRSLVATAAVLASTALLVALFWSSGEEKAGAASSNQKLWSCGANSFPLRVFSRPPGYQRKSTPLAAAIRRQAKKYPGLYAKRGWRLIFHDGREAELIRGTLKQQNQPGWISFRQVDGKWEWQGSGSCRLEPVRKGAGAGEWFLRRGTKAGSASTRFRVDVYERACSGGAPPGKRVLKPVIEYSKKSIVVTYFVKTRDGVSTCQSSPPTVKTLILKEPRGEREIVDGGTYPYPVRVAADSD